MKPCRVLTGSRIGRVLSYIVYLVAMLLLYAAGAYLITKVWVKAPHRIGAEIVTLMLVAVLAIACACLLLFITLKIHKMETRKYALSGNGITLSDGQKSFYKWSEISEIAIIAYGSAANLQCYQNVICVFIEPKTTNSLKKLLRSYLCGVFNWRRFVIIDYTPLVFEEFLQDFPGSIEDYREVQQTL